MSQTQRDLWPDDVQYDAVVPPVVILREQAGLLREKTKGLVVGEVESIDQPADEVEDYVREAFGEEKPIVHTHTLYLVAPALDYRYSLLSASHDFEPYPCVARFHPATEPDIKVLPEHRGDIPEEVHSEEAFLDWLQAVLSRQETKRVIYALISRIERNADK